MTRIPYRRPEDMTELARELTASSKMQDCLMSGRTNCNIIPAQ